MTISGSAPQLIAPVGVGSNFGEVVSLSGGGYVAVWQQQVSPLFAVDGASDTDAQAIFGRQFDASGAPVGDVYQINVTVDGFQTDPDVTELSNGNLAVAWTDGPGTDGQVDARAIIITPDGTPVGSEILLGDVQNDDQRVPVVAPVSDGGFVAMWEDDSFGRRAEDYWYGQIFDATGAEAGPQFRSVFGEEGAEDAHLLPLGNDLFTFVGPELTRGSGPTFDLNLFTYESFGATFSLPSNQSNGATPLGFREDAATVLGDGRIAIVDVSGTGSRFSPLELTVTFWETRNFENQSYFFPDPDQTDRPDPQIGLVAVNSVVITPADAGFNPGQDQLPAAAAAATADGDLLLVWSQNTGGTVAEPEITLFAQVIGVDGAFLTDPMEVATDVAGTELAPPFVSVGADGKAFIGWTVQSDRNGPGTFDLTGSVYEITLPDRSAATSGDDLIIGTSTDEDFLGSGGADTVFGREGNDLFVEDTEEITLFLRDRDVWNGGAGDDTFVLRNSPLEYLNGAVDITYGPGFDTLDLSLLEEGIGDDINSGLLVPSQFVGDPQSAIGTLYADVLRYEVPGASVGTNTGGPRSNELALERVVLHGEQGNDTISLSTRSSSPTNPFFDAESPDYIIDGGAGTDTVDVRRNEFDTENTRDSFTLAKTGDQYVLTELVDDGEGGTTPDTQGAVILRSIESLVFADQTITLDPTASRPSGAYASRDGAPDTGGGSGPGDAGAATSGNDTLTGTDGSDEINALGGDDVLRGLGGDDTLNAGDGTDTINGGPGNDRITGGETSADRRDTIFGGDGNDSIDAGHGNDLVYGQDGNDTIAGGFGADELFGQNGNDVITGSAFSDLVFGGDGDDFVNGGFGFDRINGGTGADKFFHAAADGHGSDWLQDYSAAEGDVLVFGGSGASASDFVVRFAHTATPAGERSGDDEVQEAFVNFRGQTLWALVDGGGQAQINLQIGADTFDLLA